MKVKAKFPSGGFGFYGHQRRYDGDVFTLKDPEHFSERWMEKVGPKVKSKGA